MNSEIDNADVQQQNAIEVHPIPDLNIKLVEVDNGEVNPLPDLNINVVEDIDLYMSPNEENEPDEESEPYEENYEENNAGYAEIGSEHEENYEENSAGYAEDGSEYEGNYEENNAGYAEIGSEHGDSDVPEGTSRRKVTSSTERRTIYEALLEKSVDGKLKRGLTKLVASQFSVHMRTVQRIWKLADNKGVYADVSSKRVNCGRKRIQVDFDRIRDIPLKKRSTFRDLSAASNMSIGTLARCIKSKQIRRNSNAIKPFLTEENMKGRLQFCISMLESSSIDYDPIFKGMYNTVHIDEKWFNLKEKCKTFYLLQDEEDPIRTCKSKNFIPKIMFLAAMARPRFDAQGNVLFDGKIGLFPLVTQEPAKRSSVNRPAGTLETKPIQSVNKNVIRSYLLEKVLPAIKEKWPREDIGQPIFIQQDNARTHIDNNDEEFCRVASQDGFDIRLMRQPPNSPDLNVLDLGFFRSIQALQQKESPNTIDELVAAVEISFQQYEPIKLNRIFLTLQSCMIEVMKIRGSNKYKTPHMKKEALESRDELPTQLKCDIELIQEVRQYLE